MSHPAITPSGRRDFLHSLTLAGTAALLSLRSAPVAADTPPETTRLRLVRVPAICVAPEYVAEELLRAEGFTDVHYVRKDSTGDKAPTLAAGEADITLNFAGPLIVRLDAGDPVVILAGSHVGCFELFATEAIRTLRDLKGRSVSTPALGSAEHVFLSSMLAYVGVDPRKDIRWLTYSSAETERALAEGKVDGVLAFPPLSQQLRGKKVGHVLVNSSTDRPWLQYFCCMVAANQEFVRKHPVATKRALRAFLKAADVCASEPERVARFLVDRGYVTTLDYAVQTLKELPYARWREYDPADTVRFYALRLHEAGMIKSNPQKILAQGTDWRFLNELKKELKA